MDIMPENGMITPAWSTEGSPKAQSVSSLEKAIEITRWLSCQIASICWLAEDPA